MKIPDDYVSITKLTLEMPIKILRHLNSTS